MVLAHRAMDNKNKPSKPLKTVDESSSTEPKRELYHLYWNTDTSVKVLSEQLGVAMSKLHHLVEPWVISDDTSCPNCKGPIGYFSRTGRTNQEVKCLTKCGHSMNSRVCRCLYCQSLQEKIRIQQQQAEKADQLIRLDRLVKELVREICMSSDETYLHYVLEKTSRTEKLFLRSCLQLIGPNTAIGRDDEHTWIAIARRAGVVSYPRYVRTLRKLRLLFETPSLEIFPHPCLELEWIKIPEKVRQINNKLRFQILERDDHKCRYCGRRAPDVVLHIDHIIPVAKGGTDAPDNLVTACQPCNSGKSDLLIQQIHGVSLSTYRARIRDAREALLESRREHVERVISKWKTLFGMSEWEQTEVEKWIEDYDTNILFDAFDVTRRKGDALADSFARITYTRAVIRNMSHPDPDKERAREAKLRSKKISEPQIRYITGLLDDLNLDLHEVHEKTSFDDLNGLDAYNLIQELKGRKQKL